MHTDYRRLSSTDDARIGSGPSRARTARHVGAPTPTAPPTAAAGAGPDPLAARRGGRAQVEVSAVMAGFIAWLSQRGLSVDKRRCYHLAVERFLHWREGQRRWPLGGGHPVSREIVQGYLAALRGAGHGHQQLVAAALEQLRHYLAPGGDPPIATDAAAWR